MAPEMQNSMLVGISGGSASGKTSVSEKIISSLNLDSVALVSMDSFYKCLSPEESERAANNEYDFDHPNAFDYDLIYETLSQMKRGKPVKIPFYDFKTHKRLDETREILFCRVIIFEGILAFHDKKVRDLMDLKVFVDTDSDTRLARRLIRDLRERGRDFEGVLKQYSQFVKPSFDEYILPTIKYADIILPRGKDNVIAIDLVTKYLQKLFESH